MISKLHTKCTAPRQEEIRIFILVNLTLAAVNIPIKTVIKVTAAPVAAD